MRLSVKALSGFTFLLFLCSVSTAQVKFLSNNNSDIVPQLKKVIEDHPYQFKNIIGDLIIQNPQSSEYQCRVKIKDADDSYITRYASTEKEIYSWQVSLITTENFEEAKKKFKSLYSQLNHLQSQSRQLKGEYESPVEEKRFTSVLFSFSPTDEFTKKLKIELLMENVGMEWKVRLLLYEREREDDERGNVVE